MCFFDERLGNPIQRNSSCYESRRAALGGEFSDYFWNNHVGKANTALMYCNFLNLCNNSEA